MKITMKSSAMTMGEMMAVAKHAIDCTHYKWNFWYHGYEFWYENEDGTPYSAILYFEKGVLIEEWYNEYAWLVRRYEIRED